VILKSWLIRHKGSHFEAESWRSGKDGNGQPVDEPTGAILKAEILEEVREELERHGYKIYQAPPDWLDQHPDVLEVWW
jgi:hypothetical protein